MNYIISVNFEFKSPIIMSNAQIEIHLWVAFVGDVGFYNSTDLSFSSMSKAENVWTEEKRFRCCVKFFLYNFIWEIRVDYHHRCRRY